MSGLRIFLFGRFEVRQGPEPLPGLDSRKRAELLSYILMNRDRPQVRENLVEILWADTPASKGRNYLRKTLWQLQSSLVEESAHETQPLLLVDQEWVEINPQADYWLDVAEFEKAFEMVRGKQGGSLDDETANKAEASVALYRGDLLENWYQDWCLFERERLQYHYLAMLDKLVNYCESKGQYERGVMFGETILKYDPTRERTHRRMMRLHCLLGNRPAALRQYDRCTAILNEELAIEPSNSTRFLYEQIRNDLFNADNFVETLLPSSGNDVSNDPAMSIEKSVLGHPEKERGKKNSLSLALNTLIQINLTLAQVQHNIQEDIQKVKQALREFQ